MCAQETLLPQSGYNEKWKAPQRKRTIGYRNKQERQPMCGKYRRN